MEQTKDLEIRAHIHNYLILNKFDKNSNGERIFYLINVLGELASHMQKTETGSLPYNLYKN